MIFITTPTTVSLLCTLSVLMFSLDFVKCRRISRPVLANTIRSKESSVLKDLLRENINEKQYSDNLQPIVESLAEQVTPKVFKVSTEDEVEHLLLVSEDASKLSIENEAVTLPLYSVGDTIESLKKQTGLSRTLLDTTSTSFSKTQKKNSPSLPESTSSMSIKNQENNLSSSHLEDAFRTSSNDQKKLSPSHINGSSTVSPINQKESLSSHPDGDSTLSLKVLKKHSPSLLEDSSTLSKIDQQSQNLPLLHQEYSGVPLKEQLHHTLHRSKRRASYPSECRGSFVRNVLDKVDDVCDQCYNLYRQYKVAIDCRADCYGSLVYEFCLDALYLDKKKYAKMVRLLRDF